jgi:CubicO group peptidase (beta-lactamase class C family)
MSEIGRERELATRGRTTQAGIIRRRRRWVLGLIMVAAVLLALVLAVYGWAWLALDRSSIARAMLWREADVGDQHRFPARPIPTGIDASALPAAAEVPINAVPVGAREGAPFEAFLRDTGTYAFLVVHDDRLVYERYFEGSDRQTLHTSFSVAKSFVSTLVGIAIDEGLIGSVDDRVTEYVPELAERDPRFQDIPQDQEVELR